MRASRRGLRGAAVGGRDLGRDGQPEAGAGTARMSLGAVEALEDVRQLVRRDAGAVAAYAEELKKLPTLLETAKANPAASAKQRPSAAPSPTSATS